MMRTLILIIVVAFAYNYNPNREKLQVVERSAAMQINKGYVVLSSDSVFEFNNKKYLIKSSEFFDENNEISHALIWSEMGYEDYPKKNLFEIKHFMQDNNLSQFIKASIVDAKHIKVNADIGLIKGIDKQKKIIYYSLKNDNNVNGLVYLHRLIYK